MDITRIGIGGLSNTFIKEIVLGDSVTEIGNGTFPKSSSLTSISIPSNVAYIGNNVFLCSSIVELFIYNPDIEIGSFAFDNTDPNLTLYGPSDSNVEYYAEENDLQFSPL